MTQLLLRFFLRFTYGEIQKSPFIHASRFPKHRSFEGHHTIRFHPLKACGFHLVATGAFSPKIARNLSREKGDTSREFRPSRKTVPPTFMVSKLAVSFSFSFLYILRRKPGNRQQSEPSKT